MTPRPQVWVEVLSTIHTNLQRLVIYFLQSQSPGRFLTVDMLLKPLDDIIHGRIGNTRVVPLDPLEI